jgi:tight adherence protein C
VLVQLTVSFLVAVATISLGAGALLTARLKREARLARVRVLQPPGFDGVDEVAQGGSPSQLQTRVRRLGESLSRQQVSGQLRKSLASAGIYSPTAPALYLGYKVVFFLLSFAGLAALVGPLDLPLTQRVLLISLGSAGFFFVPNLVLAHRRSRRRTEVQRHLPDAVDMLEICVSAGMGLDAAWNNVAEESRKVSPVLADEMELTNLEINLGLGRATAMRHMAERTNVPDISSLVALLIQADRFGASVVEALKVYAETMRELRRQRAEEEAEKTAVKLIFPMVLFVFPPLLMVMVGPALIGLFQTMGS